MNKPVPVADVPDETFDALRASKPVLLVGSAASMFSPTNLPNGQKVADDLVEWLAGGPNRWPCWLFEDAKQLPFEAVLDAYPDQESLLKIICSLYGDPNLKPNSIHASIGDGLIDGTFSGLITTNYDLAFDNYFKDTPEISPILNEEQGSSWMNNPSGRRVYWKIHGTGNNGRSIVANLARERRMDPWKRSLLRRLVIGRLIIFLGYSGRDFDICPELACKREHFHAVWLVRSPDLNANQTRIIEKTSVEVIDGTLHGFLEKLCRRSIEVTARLDRGVNVRDYFDARLLEEWRIRLLKRLACPSICMNLLNSFSPSPGSTLKVRISMSHMLGHQGRYHDQVRILDSRISDAKDQRDKLTRFLDASTAWGIYGSARKSRARLESARKIASSIKAEDHQRGHMAEAELLLWVRKYFFLQPMPCLKRWVQRHGKKEYLTAVRAFQRTDLDALYSVHHDAERIHVDVKGGFAAAAAIGFRALGLRSMQSQKERDRITALERPLTRADVASCEEWHARAIQYGWQPEAWKWAWILIWHCGQWNRSMWCDWLCSFLKTQYTWMYRIKIFVQYLLRGLTYKFCFQRPRAIKDRSAVRSPSG